MVNENYQPKFDESIKKEFQELIKKCLSPDPNERPSLDEIIIKISNTDSCEYLLDDVDLDEYKMYFEDILQFIEPKKGLLHRISILTEENEQRKNQIEKMKNEKEQEQELIQISNLNEKYHQYKNENINLKNYISQIEKEKEQIIKQISSINKENTQFKNEIIKLKNHISQIEQEKEQMTKQITFIKEKNCKLKNNIMLLKNKFSQIEKENENALIQVSNLNEENHQYKNENINLKNYISQIEKEKEQIIKQISSINKENTQFKNEIIKLKNHISQEKEQMAKQIKLPECVITSKSKKLINIYSDKNLVLSKSSIFNILHLTDSPDVNVSIYSKSLHLINEQNEPNPVISCDGNLTIEAINCQLKFANIKIICSQNLTLKGDILRT